jgi:23S rRNA (adenine2503-C2)-methyltransferase
MQDLLGRTLAELEQSCDELQVSRLHARTLFRDLYKSFNREPWNNLTLPQALRKHLLATSRVSEMTIAQESLSRYDGTVKFLMQLEDGALVESVLMPEKKRITLCISSQVGCAQACTFCYTGRMGLKRQLTAGEIVGQVMRARRWIQEHPEWHKARSYPPTMTISNVVFMGMGEPLDNLEAVTKALSIMIEPVGLHLAQRRISVSTAGHLEGIQGLLEAFPQVALALSLHATNDRERSQLMPINRRWPIGTILDFLRRFYQQHPDEDRSLLVQYTVIRGVNDSPRHAQELLSLLEGLPVKVNLIPLNEVEPSRFQGPDPRSLEAFRDTIHSAGMRVMIRYSKGQDIEAACGQLVIKHETPSKVVASAPGTLVF